MDEYADRRVAGRLAFSRRGANLSLRDPNHEDRSIHCSRLGFSTRSNAMKGAQVSKQEKCKYSKTSFRSSSSKSIAESSSTSSVPSGDFRRFNQEKRNQISLRETIIAESSGSRQQGDKEIRYDNMQELVEDSEYSSRQEETDDSEFSSEMSGTHTGLPGPEDLELATLQGLSTNTTEALGSTGSFSGIHKDTNRRLGSEKKYNPGSSVRRSFVSRSTTYVAKHISQGTGAGTQKYGLKNLGCTSISDVLSGCSSSGVSHNRRIDAIRKRPSDGENLSWDRSMNGSSNGRYSVSSRVTGSGPHPDSASSQPNLRRVRNQSASRDGAVSVRTRRVPAEGTGVRLPEEVNDVIGPPSETIVTPQVPQTRFSIPEVAPESSSRSFQAELPPLYRNAFGRSATSQSARTRYSSSIQDSNIQISRRHLGDRDRDRDRYRRFNMEGIAEVLLALERIEQDQELSYEQLLVLETNLLLGGLGFHDQHRDMRLDIDNMSYEELLALEDKMGSVSTALSEEALAKCLKRSVYTPASAFPGITSHKGDDIKCSICQEEYAVGEEVGNLACQHRYHMSCIRQWLKQKNWCPICKVCACPPS